MEFNVKQAIIDRLYATRRCHMVKLLNYMSKNGFFTRHCHRHHKYVSGLADHSWQTYQIAWRLNAENRKKNPTAPLLNEDSIAIAALLHDLCNCSGFCDISGHGRRSAKILKELGFILTDEEYLAIRFHMSLKGKESHSHFEDAKRSQLRYLIHKADGMSAKLGNGHDEPIESKTLYYLQNITKLDCKDIIFQVQDGWFLNLHSPYDGEIDTGWKDKIIGVKIYNTADLYGINDSIIGAIYVLSLGDKKALFTLHHYHGMQGGCYFSPDKNPFTYNEIKVYSDWNEWNNFGYAACKQNNGWKLVKVTQFPTPNYEVLGEGFSSAEEAMKSIDIDDCERYINKWGYDQEEKQENDENFSSKFVSAMETIGITVVDDETNEQIERSELIDYLKENMGQEIREEADDLGIEPLDLKVVAVNVELDAILYEDSSGIEADGCNHTQLKHFFPDYQFDFYKQYFIKINDVFYHGDTLEDVILDYIYNNADTDDIASDI